MIEHFIAAVGSLWMVWAGLLGFGLLVCLVTERIERDLG